MTHCPPQLDPLLAVAAAAIDTDGGLLWANAGFCRLLDITHPAPIGTPVANFFRQPDFVALLRMPARPDGVVHEGLITIGDFADRTSSLRGRIWCDGTQLRMIAEHDISELAQLTESLLELNGTYAEGERALTQANLVEHQLNESLAVEKAALQDTLNRLKRLEGVISLCMYCKKMRTADDAWQKLELYLSEHTDARFSHGLCPSCLDWENSVIRGDAGVPSR